MSATELQFRTATFGGFQKQDVLSYIESSNQAHVEKLEQLRVLEAGIAIRVLEVEAMGPGVDTPEDLEQVRRILSENAG